MSAIIPQFEKWTDEQIRQDNERIQKAMRQDEPSPSLQRRATPEQTIGSLRERVAKFRTFPKPEEGYTLPVIEPVKPTCTRCNNLGVIRYDVPPDHRLYKKDIPCDVEGGCPVRVYQLAVRANELAEREARHFGTKIEYFVTSRMSDFADDERAAVKVARLFLEYGAVSYDGRSKRSLVFTGEVGRAKTSLISAMRNEIAARGEHCQFRKIRTMLKAVQHGYNKDAEFSDTEAEMILSTTPYLFIDEFETLVSGDRSDILESIIDQRYREDLPTIIATNLDQNKTWHVWGDRIPSRLIHMAHWIEMGGESLRDGGKTIRDR